MKETTFTFGIEIADQDAYRSLEEKLRSLKGVVSVNVQEVDGEWTLAIGASIASADGAKLLHRKIMATLLATQNLVITRTTTRLTDIF